MSYWRVVLVISAVAVFEYHSISAQVVRYPSSANVQFYQVPEQARETTLLEFGSIQPLIGGVSNTVNQNGYNRVSPSGYNGFGNGFSGVPSNALTDGIANRFSGNGVNIEQYNGFLNNGFINNNAQNSGSLNGRVQNFGGRYPTFEFLNRSGVRITMPGPYEQSNVYRLKFYVNVNRDLNNIKNGQYNGEVSLPAGSSWTFTIPNLRVNYFDTVYYIVEVQGTQGRRTWTREYKGFYQIPDRNPHGSQNVPGMRPAIVQTEDQRFGVDTIPNPKFEYFNPRGLRITLQGPFEDTDDQYQLTYYVNINQNFGNVKSGQYRGEMTLARGSPWAFTVPEVRVKQLDTIYYWVEVKGRRGLRTWFREFKGFWQLPERDPHGSGPPLPQLPYAPPPDTLPPYVPPPNTLPPYVPPPNTPPPYVPPPNTPSPYVPPPSSRPTQCKTSFTDFNDGQKPCIGASLTNYIQFKEVEQIGGSELEESFTVFSKDNVVSNGFKYKSIVPSLLEDKYGERFVDNSLTMPDCTSKDQKLCSYKAAGYKIIPPILSGRQTTEETLFFRYGTLEVTAKLPSGDWVVPELWLMPKHKKYGRSSGKIVLALSRGNSQLRDGLRDNSNHVLEAGILTDSRQDLNRLSQDRPWTDDFHKFRLYWTPNELIFYVDNKVIGNYTSGPNGLDPSLRGTKLAPFDQEFFLVFGIHVGGDKDFPDSPDKPWLNSDNKNKVNFWRQKSKWHPTWSRDTALHISDVTITALDF